MEAIDQLRLIIGDIDEATQHFTDDQLEAFLEMDSDVRGAAALALESWAVSLAASASDVQLGDYRQMDYHKAREMRELAKSLRASITVTPAFAIAKTPGTVSRASLLEKVLFG